MKSNADVQRALIALGYDLGKGGPSGKGDDDAWGGKSKAAALAYQSKNGLKPTGLPNADLIVRLFPGVVAPVILPPWYAEAKRLKGLREIAGKQNSSVIMGWARALGLGYANDETAWCGLFVAHCMAFALPGEAQPANPLGARNWLKFGREIKTPSPGAVLVFWRGSKAGWSGHVGLYAGEHKSDGAWRVLGGNQSDSVSETWLARDRLLGMRWPSTYPLPTGGRVLLTAGGGLSTNEA